VRQMLQRTNLHAEFLQMLPTLPRPIRVQRWTARRVGLLAVAAGLLLLVVPLTGISAFDNNVAVRTSLHVDGLGCGGPLEPLLVMAQSVPSATLLPCVSNPLPGWRVAEVAVNDGRSVVTLDHDRAGREAVVLRLAATCYIGTAVKTVSDDADVSRYESLERIGGGYAATRYDRFQGGCVTYQLRSNSDPNGAFASEAQVLLGFTSRQELARRLEQRSGGRLHVDAGTAR
jgi:hypothetical protein